MTRAEYKKVIKELSELFHKYKVRVVCTTSKLSPTLRRVERKPEPINIIPTNNLKILKGEILGCVL